jgi:hypothetical protein
MAAGFLIPWIPVLALLALGVVLMVRRRPFRGKPSGEASQAD